MNGRKFVIYFVAAMILTGASLSLWIKQSYDSRQNEKIFKPINEPTIESAIEPATEPSKY